MTTSPLIIETQFPATYTERSRSRYVVIPQSVVERMGLKDGDYLDIVVKRPKTEKTEDNE